MIRPIRPMDFEQVRTIFFATSAIQVFSSDDHRKQLEWKYLGWYLESQRPMFFVAEEPSPGESTEEAKILGYIACCPDTKSATELLSINPYLEIFSDLYDSYPAHLHINLAEASRGQGLGSQLIQHLEGILRDQGIRGLHLVTSPDARNRSFYRKNGFHVEFVRPYKGTMMLFMGKSL